MSFPSLAPSAFSPVQNQGVLDSRLKNPDLIGPFTSLPASAPIKHTTTPYVTGTSVVALKFDGGVMMAADTLGSYGTLARFMRFERLIESGGVLVGGSGDLSDLQYVHDELDALRTRETEYADGQRLGARELWAYLTRVMYARRNKGDPIYNQLLLADVRDGKPFLAQVDLHGTAYEDDTLATGYGSQLARPILRNEWRPDMTRQQARAVLETCMRVLYYRDTKTINRIQFGTVTADGVTIDAPVELATNWEIGNRAPDAQGSW